MINILVKVKNVMNKILSAASVVLRDRFKFCVNYKN